MKYNLESTIRQINESPQAVALMDQILPGMREKLAASPQTVNLSLTKVAIYAKDPVLKEKIQTLAEQLANLGEVTTDAETKRIQSYLKLAKSDRENVTGHPHHQDAIYPGKPWLDENGHRIQAHGGAIFYENGTYYWYGEDKTHSLGYPQTSIWTWGIHAYQSIDLCNWSDLGLIIAPDLTNPDSAFFRKPTLIGRIFVNVLKPASTSPGLNFLMMNALSFCRRIALRVPIKLFTIIISRLTMPWATLILQLMKIKPVICLWMLIIKAF